MAFKLNLDFTKKPERVSYYVPFESDIQLGNVECPVSLQKIPIIEMLNNLRINVFGVEDEEVYPLYVSSKEDSDVINLLVVDEGEKQHYCLIRKFSRLLGDLTNLNGATYYCYRFLHRFTNQDLLDRHGEYCSRYVAQRIHLPRKRKHILSFPGTHLQHPVAFTSYAEFESLLTPIASASLSASTSYSDKATYYFPFGYAYVVVKPMGDGSRKQKYIVGKTVLVIF